MKNLGVKLIIVENQHLGCCFSNMLTDGGAWSPSDVVIQGFGQGWGADDDVFFVGDGEEVGDKVSELCSSFD